MESKDIWDLLKDPRGELILTHIEIWNKNKWELIYLKDNYFEVISEEKLNKMILNRRKKMISEIDSSLHPNSEDYNFEVESIENYSSIAEEYYRISNLMDIEYSDYLFGELYRKFDPKLNIKLEYKRGYPNDISSLTKKIIDFYAIRPEDTTFFSLNELTSVERKIYIPKSISLDFVDWIDELDNNNYAAIHRQFFRPSFYRSDIINYIGIDEWISLDIEARIFLVKDKASKGINIEIMTYEPDFIDGNFFRIIEKIFN